VIRIAAPLAICSLLAGTGQIAAQTTALEGSWVLAVGEDPSSYEVVASLQQQSANTIKDEYATNDVKPVLAFRCAPGNQAITARIDWQRFISSFNTEVGFKVDDGKPLWLKWGVDQSNKITLSKTTADTQLLLDYLGGGGNLQVEVTPYSESPMTVEFELAGFSQSLDALRAACQ
jgi:hypothetical protein